MLNLESLFRPWKVFNLQTNEILEVSACNAEFALLEAGKLVYTAAQSNELPIIWEGKIAQLGVLVTHSTGRM